MRGNYRHTKIKALPLQQILQVPSGVQAAPLGTQVGPVGGVVVGLRVGLPGVTVGANVEGGNVGESEGASVKN